MSEKKRFFVNTIQEETILDGEEFLHAKNVLRLGVGDEIILLDNTGIEYTGIVSIIEKHQMKVHILGKNKGEKEAKTSLCLIFGYLKNADKNEFVVQKATELGFEKIVLFSSKYSSAYMNDNKLERLKKVAQESAKQCLRATAPSIEYVDTFDKALQVEEKYKNKIFACEFTDKSELDLKTIQGATAIMIGSEGGFSQEEFEKAQENGWKGVTLGKRILRAETAAISLGAVVAFLVGEWQ